MKRCYQCSGADQVVAAGHEYCCSCGTYGPVYSNQAEEVNETDAEILARLRDFSDPHFDAEWLYIINSLLARMKVMEEALKKYAVPKRIVPYGVAKNALCAGDLNNQFLPEVE